jgi:ABC-type antimicrobial peptide transport system permease subunit
VVQRAPRLAVVRLQRHLHGNDATPLWLPQLTMAFGAVVLAIAFVDELVLEWRGTRRVARPKKRCTTNRWTRSSPRS